VLRIWRSVLAIGAALFGGLLAMVLTGIVMLVAYPGTVIGGCHTSSVRGGPEVCTSASTFWEVLVTAGIVGTVAVGVGILSARQRHPVPFSH